MLIFNYKKEFVGIDANDLEVFGFTTLAELQAEATDFADMFVKKPGFIHNFKHVNWIDFVECSDSQENAKVIIHANSKNFQCFMSVETMFLSDQPSSKAFLIHLHNIQELTENQAEYISVDLLKQSTPEAPKARPKPLDTPPPAKPIIKSEPEVEPKIEFEAKSEVPPIKTQTSSFDADMPLDLDFDDAEEELENDLKIDLESEDEEVQNTLIANEVFDNGYIFDPKIASNELGLPVDLIEEFIEDFIAQAKEFQEELYESHNAGDNANLKILSHKLKGVAANLRIEDALESLTIINTSNNNADILAELDTFYKIIAKLSGETISVIAQEQEIVPQEIVLEVTEDEILPLDIEDLDLDFKNDIDDDLDIFSAPSKAPIQEEIIEQEDATPEDDFQLDFKEDIKIEPTVEVQDQEIPSHIDMPELADDDFAPQDEEEVEELKLELDSQVNNEPNEPASEIFTPPTITYSKENIASEIGLDQESFDELFEDYLTEAKDIANSIDTAIETENVATWKHLAIRLKGMSDNMRVKDFTRELETLINSQEVSVAKEANTKVIQCITELSKIEE